jgi:hypothetical protein
VIPPPGLESRTTKDTVEVQKQVTAVSDGMAPRQSWQTVATLTCWASELSGRAAFVYTQRGFSKPWVFLFSQDPGIRPDINQIKYVGSDGVSHFVQVRSAIHQEGVLHEVWVVEGDEITQEPRE